MIGCLENNRSLEYKTPGIFWYQLLSSIPPTLEGSRFVLWFVVWSPPDFLCSGQGAYFYNIFLWKNVITVKRTPFPNAWLLEIPIWHNKASFQPQVGVCALLTPCVILNISVYAITPKRQIKQFPLRQFRENYCVTSWLFSTQYFRVRWNLFF